MTPTTVLLVIIIVILLAIYMAMPESEQDQQAREALEQRVLERIEHARENQEKWKNFANKFARLSTTRGWHWH